MILMLCGLSVEEKYKKNFPKDFFFGTFYQQHFKEGWSGYRFVRGNKFIGSSWPGLFRSNFEDRIDDFNSTLGIGYCGASKEPIEIDTRMGVMCLCFSGNIINYLELKEELKQEGVSFSSRGNDHLEIEVIGKLIARGRNIPEGIEIMNKKIIGSYTLLILTKEKIFFTRSPDGHWTLLMGIKDGERMVASSSAGFSNLGFKIEREVKAGEIGSLKNGIYCREKMMLSKQVQTCSFLAIYSDFPSANFLGQSIAFLRKELSRRLARKDIEENFAPDVVIPVPDSGRFHTLGYYHEFCNQVREGKLDRKRLPDYDEFFIKYPYATRSFTPLEEKKRKEEAIIKILTSGESLIGKVVVVVDDSIVRGNQVSANLVPKLKNMGADEIHFRIASPKLLSYCPWGKTTKKGGELLSLIVPEEEQAKKLGIKSIKYNSLQDLIEVLGKADKLCLDCYRK
jgi:amidophosphoribosyltransferase